MQGIVKAEPKRGAQLQGVRVSEIGLRDVRVGVASNCGTDLHIYRWDRWLAQQIHLRECLESAALPER